MAATSPAWPCPQSPGALQATVRLPGSKSQTIRALVIGAIAAHPTQLEGALAARDTVLAAQMISQFGAQLEASDQGDRNSLVIVPPTKLQATPRIDCGLAGTVMRFGPALAAFAEGETHFDGDEAARKRPLAPLLDALEQLGATVTYAGEPGFLPFTVRGISAEVGSGEKERRSIATPESAPVNPDLLPELVVYTTSSSQYLSALLLASPLFPHPVRLRAAGKLPSRPYVQMSLNMLADQGVQIRQSGEAEWITCSRRPVGRPIEVEPDLSNAGPFLAAALVCGGRVTVPHWPTETNQVGQYWLEILPQLGATVTPTPQGLTVSAPVAHRWSGIELEMRACGELAPTLAALCVLADSPSMLTGIGHLRGHETDRLQALATEIERVGGSAQVLEDGLRIIPPAAKRSGLRPVRFCSYEDHRMATFGAILGLAVPGCEVENIATTSKTLPDFPERWHAMLEGQASVVPAALLAALQARQQDVPAANGKGEVASRSSGSGSATKQAQTGDPGSNSLTAGTALDDR